MVCLWQYIDRISCSEWRWLIIIDYSIFIFQTMGAFGITVISKIEGSIYFFKCVGKVLLEFPYWICDLRNIEEKRIY
jgi:hypothetical protein